MIQIEQIPSIINLAIVMATPIAMASIGEVFSERSGVVNLGVEGMMLMGAFTSFHTAYLTNNLPLAYLVAVVTGILMALIHAFLSITLRVDQTISGMGLYFLGFGLSDFLYKTIYGSQYVSINKTSMIPIPLLSQIPVLGYGLFTNYPLTYFTLLSVFLAWFLINKTRFGLHTRAVGENPRVADSLGINVSTYKYVSVVIGGAFAGLAGAFLCIDINGLFYENMTLGMGFIAVGLVAFGRWSPLRAYAGSLIFGFTWSISSTLQGYFQQAGFSQYVYALLMLPYLAVIIALIMMSRKAKGPAWLGLPYYRE